MWINIAMTWEREKLMGPRFNLSPVQGWKRWPQTRGHNHSGHLFFHGIRFLSPKKMFHRFFHRKNPGDPRPLPLAICSLPPSLLPLSAPRGQEPRHRPWRASSPGKPWKKSWWFFGLDIPGKSPVLGLVLCWVYYFGYLGSIIPYFGLVIAGSLRDKNAKIFSSIVGSSLLSCSVDSGIYAASTPKYPNLVMRALSFNVKI